MPKGIKNQSKIDAKMMLEKNMRTILKMDPNWSQNEPKWKLKCIQNVKKEPKGRLRVARVRPKERAGKELKNRCQNVSIRDLGAEGGGGSPGLKGGTPPPWGLAAGTSNH